MLGLRAYFRSAPGPEDPDSSPHVRLLTWQQSEADRLGIPWPRPKAGRGQPGRLKKWRALLYDRLESGAPLPIEAMANPPPEYVIGQSLEAAFLTEEEVCQDVEQTLFSDEPEVAEEPKSKKRKKVTVDPVIRK